MAQGGRCAICGSTKRFSVHHLANRRSGGSDDLANLLGLCIDCHNGYEGDKRAGRTTDLTQAIDGLTK